MLALPISKPDAEPPDDLRAEHLLAVQRFYDDAPTRTTLLGRHYRRLLARYYRMLIPADASVLEVGCGSGELLALLPNRDVMGVDLSATQVEAATRRVPHGRFEAQAGESLQLDRTFDVIILSETANQAADLQRLLERLHPVAHERTRVVLNYYNAAWRPLLALASWLGLRASQPPSNWLGVDDVANLLHLAGWEVIKRQARVLAPAPLLGLDRLANRYLAPLLGWLCLTAFTVARPAPRQGPAARAARSVSVIVPARNEAGNVADAVRRIPQMGESTEIIFVEGHSKDDTWVAIQKAVRDNPHLDVKAMRQTGKGKGNAVREAMEVARGDLVMILDADLTMPPEELPKFYEVLASNRAEFANGVRLVYPMQDQAMRFLNLCGNKFFSAAFTWALGQPIKDTLCGTKALYRSDYHRIAANRADFGDFDPFGDFDLIFGADRLQLKLADVPIRYRNRTYGETNIQRWRHGLLLLRMLLIAIRKIKLG
jgi:SAM-dependent methyltransferase